MKKISLEKTGERLLSQDVRSREEYLLYLRHLFAYRFAEDKLDDGDVVLEVGSGEGYGAMLLSGKAKKIIGLDVVAAVVDFANENYKKENCSFQFYGGEKIPFPDNSFNVVVSFQVIEHVVEAGNYLQEIARVLKPGGIFILTTPNKKGRVKRNSDRPFNKFHVREYLAIELEGLLKNVFNEVSVFGVTARTDIVEIEKQRISKILKIVFWDPLGLRFAMPDFLRLLILKAIRLFDYFKKHNIDQSYLEHFKVSDFFITDVVNDSLDLLTVCKK